MLGWIFHNLSIATFPLLSIIHSGEQEFVARTAGVSTLVIVSAIIPIILIVLIISYRLIERKNFELEEEESKLRFAELEKQRRSIYKEMFETHQQKEVQIEKLLNELDEKSPEKSTETGESTDDEFFEEPLAASPHATDAAPVWKLPDVPPRRSIPSSPQQTSVEPKWKLPIVPPRSKILPVHPAPPAPPLQSDF